MAGNSKGAASRPPLPTIKPNIDEIKREAAAAVRNVAVAEIIMPQSEYAIPSRRNTWATTPYEQRMQMLNDELVVDNLGSRLSTNKIAAAGASGTIRSYGLPDDVVAKEYDYLGHIPQASLYGMYSKHRENTDVLRNSFLREAEMEDPEKGKTAREKAWDKHLARRDADTQNSATTDLFGALSGAPSEGDEVSVHYKSMQDGDTLEHELMHRAFEDLGIDESMDDIAWGFEEYFIRRYLAELDKDDGFASPEEYSAYHTKEMRANTEGRKVVKQIKEDLGEKGVPTDKDDKFWAYMNGTYKAMKTRLENRHDPRETDVLDLLGRRERFEHYRAGNKHVRLGGDD